MIGLPGRAEFEELLIHEAWLLDRGELDRWLELFAEDVRYWAPVRSELSRGKEDFTRPHFVAHFDDNKFGLTIRVKRMQSGSAYSNEPPARTRRLVTNVKVLEAREQAAIVASNFAVFRSRGADERFYVGAREDHLRRSDGAWKVFYRCITFDHNIVDSLTILI